MLGVFVLLVVVVMFLYMMMGLLVFSGVGRDVLSVMVFLLLKFLMLMM